MQGIRSIDSILSQKRMRQLAEEGQRPFAIVLTCSDSRVPAEMIFDQGLGDLFVIRVAGNIVAPSLIASIEFAAASFETPVCVVMGHTKCGAMNAAVSAECDGVKPGSKNLERLVDAIRPAVRACEGSYSLERSKLVAEVTHQNVQHSVETLISESPLLQDLIQQGKFAVTGAVYDIFSGQVTFNADGKTGENPSLSRSKGAQREFFQAGDTRNAT